MTQASQVAQALEAATGIASELVPIRVDGDDHSMALGETSRPGVFTSALRDALLANRVDYVVHSCKDLPSEPWPGLVLAAVPERANPLDVLVGPPDGLQGLPPNAIVGTSSPRRAAGIGRLRPDLRVVPIRGNVDTRLRKTTDGTVNATVMAVAGLERLGLLDPAWRVFTSLELVPAPAQGALAVECLSEHPLLPLLAQLDHGPSRLAVQAERAVLAGVAATCTTAIGALARLDGNRLTLQAELSQHRGVAHARVERSVTLMESDSATKANLAVAQSLGQQVAAALMSGNPRPKTGSTVRLSSTPVTVRAGTALPEPVSNSANPVAPDLIRAYRGERTARRPVWFMRQAGRSLPEYRQARAGTAMLEACLTPQLAAEITCQPVRRHQVDAAIFFSDIMVPAKLAGIEVEIVPGRGPVLAQPIRCASDIAKLPELDPAALVPITLGVSAAVAELGATPLIGFAGAPFTVASYLVEGEPSRSFPHTKALMAQDEAAWHKLAAWVAQTTLAFLLAQLQSGAQAVQLFDSWVGALTPEQYARFARPHSKAVFQGLATASDVPRVHFGTGTAGLLPQMHTAGASVMGVDASLGLDQAELNLGGDVPLQGNIDPEKLSGPWEELAVHVRQVLAAGTSAPGHVVNLGHGVPPTTDPDRLTRLVELIHSIPDPAANQDGGQ